MTSRWLRQFRHLASKFDQVKNVEGDIVECGVGKGRTFLMFAYLLSEEKDNNRELWGFDSFQGFPEPSAEDKSLRNPKKGELGDTDIDGIIKLLDASGIEKQLITTRIKLVPGFFNDSLKKFPDKSIALLHIDVDLYESYRDVLNILFPKVAKGGIVLFDEYNELKWPGATKAIDEYFKNTSYKIKKDEIAGKYYIIK
jgi:hypothetical protein